MIGAQQAALEAAMSRVELARWALEQPRYPRWRVWRVVETQAGASRLVGLPLAESLQRRYGGRIERAIPSKRHARRMVALAAIEASS